MRREVRLSARVSSQRSALTLTAVVSAALLLAAPAAMAAKSADTVRVIVGFKANAEAAGRRAVVAAGARTRHDLPEVSALAVELPRAALAKLRANANVEYVEEDALVYAIGTAKTPKMPRARGVAAAAAGTEQVPYGISMVQADQLSDAQAGNRKLCIVDSGIDASHEDLAGNILAGENFSGSGSWSTDEGGHGTHVAGTIAALHNTLGVEGVLPSGKLHLHIAKVFDASGSAATSVITKGMLSCLKAKANVVSMSLGGPSSRTEQRVVSLMAKRNMLLIAAAGNAGDNTVSYPAGFAEVVSVAAVDSTGAKGSFSQFNSDVEISGPGVAVLSSVPMGTGVVAAFSAGGTEFAVNAMTGTPVSTATAPLADFGLGEVVNTAVAGKVCLIQRGNISFADKVLNCQNSGGVGALVVNNVAGSLFGTLGTTVTTIPSVGAAGEDAAALAAKVGQSATVALTPTNYAALDGTSMATPHVSAVAALVWSYYPSCTASQIRTSLNNSAVDLGDAGRDVNYGYGLVQARAAFDRIATLGCGV